MSALVAGMVAGDDSIDDMRLLRHGAMGTLLARPYAPSTLGSFLREFRFGHVRQLDAVASRLLTGLCQRTRVRVLTNKAHFEPELPLPTLVSGDLASTPPKDGTGAVMLRWFGRTGRFVAAATRPA